MLQVGTLTLVEQDLVNALCATDEFTAGELIGRGGQRVVFRGTFGGEDAAIKVTPAELRDRLEREIALAHSFDHPALVPILSPEPVELRLGEHELLCFAEKLVTGSTVAAGDRLTACDAVSLAEDVWSALDYLAERNVVHRDVTPKNIMQRFTYTRPRYVLLDVGVARHLDLVPITATHLAGPGTATYAAPEQFEPRTSREVDWRTDLFGLGVVLYEQLTGALPYEPAAHASWLQTGGCPDHPDLPVPWKPVLDQLLHRRQFGRPRRSVMTGLLAELREELGCS